MRRKLWGWEGEAPGFEGGSARVGRKEALRLGGRILGLREALGCGGESSGVGRRKC